MPNSLKRASFEARVNAFGGLLDPLNDQQTSCYFLFSRLVLSIETDFFAKASSRRL